MEKMFVNDLKALDSLSTRKFMIKRKIFIGCPCLHRVKVSGGLSRCIDCQELIWEPGFSRMK